MLWYQRGQIPNRNPQRIAAAQPAPYDARSWFSPNGRADVLSQRPADQAFAWEPTKSYTLNMLHRNSRCRWKITNTPRGSRRCSADERQTMHRSGGPKRTNRHGRTGTGPHTTAQERVQHQTRTSAASPSKNGRRIKHHARTGRGSSRQPTGRNEPELTPGTNAPTRQLLCLRQRQRTDRPEGEPKRVQFTVQRGSRRRGK